MVRLALGGRTLRRLWPSCWHGMAEAHGARVHGGRDEEGRPRRGILQVRRRRAYLSHKIASDARPSARPALPRRAFLFVWEPGFSWAALTKCRCSEIVLGDPNNPKRKVVGRLTGQQEPREMAIIPAFCAWRDQAATAEDGASGTETVEPGGSGSPFVSSARSFGYATAKRVPGVQLPYRPET